MKSLILRVFVLFLRALYVPMKWRKTTDTIVWLSRQSNEPSEDMRLLSERLRERFPDTRQVFRLRLLRDASGLSSAYVWGLIGDMRAIAGARLVLTDTYSIAVSCLHHKKDLTVVQLWHALGAVKKFSLQAAGKAQGRDAAVAKALHMHEGYDYVVAPSQAAADAYCEAFGCDRSAIKVLSLPRVDVLMDGQTRREEFLRENPAFAGNPIVAYVPTFRTGDAAIAADLARAFADGPASLAVSPHPLTPFDERPSGDFSSRDLIKLADAVVTDYSACAFEAALLGKPLYFYVPDYDSYCAEQGLNVDLRAELPGTVFTDAAALANAVADNRYDFGALRAFADKYVTHRGTDNTEALCNWLGGFLTPGKENP